MNILKLIHKAKDAAVLLSSCRMERDPDLFVFGAWYGEKFADNPRYLFLHYLKRGKRAYWIAKNEKLYEDMKRKGLPVLLCGTEAEREISQKAKYFFYCCSLDDINKLHAGGATMINLWHGVPLKKIMYDDTYNYNTGKASLYERTAERLLAAAFRRIFVVTTSKTMLPIYEHAFRLDAAHVLNLGQPRNDCFFDSSLQRVHYGNREYEKLITYMPTMRNMGKQPIDLHRILDLDRLNELCRANSALFLVKKHFCHRNEVTDLSAYSNILDMTTAEIDAQELLYNTDILITDYSSCYIDYLLLSRPVVFYAYDLADYLKRDREMYFPYEAVTPGPKAETFEQLYASLTDLLENSANQTDKEFAEIRDLFYDPENQGPVSDRIMKAVEKL